MNYDLPSVFCIRLLIGRQEEHPACKKFEWRCALVVLSGARCKWFAYGPADATATPSSLATCFIKIQIGLTFLQVPAYPGCPGKEAAIRVLCLCLHVCLLLFYRSGRRGQSPTFCAQWASTVACPIPLFCLQIDFSSNSYWIDLYNHACIL